ncbi:MAG: diguanylate cyclase [Oscillospiraceae bacterium]|nr:diguanylate cyclase [Oscillospiraceae bacterium]
MFFSVARKDSSRSIYFVLFASAITVYTAGCILIEMGSTQDGIMNALRIANLGIPFIAPCFLFISICLFQPKYIKSWMLPAVGVYGLSMFFLILFNDNHHLYYSNIAVEILENNISRIVIERGILFWVQQGIALIFTISAYVILLRRFIPGNKKLRYQMFYVIIGAFVVFIANIINFTGLLPEELDLMPFAMTVALIFISVNIAKHKLLDIGVSAPNTVLKTMDDAVIILDNDWCLLSCNDKAKLMFPSLEAFSETEPITKVRDWPCELEAADKTNEIVFELEKNSGDGSKFTYRANTDKIIDINGTHVGWSIIIHDTTSITFLINQLENLATTDFLTGISNRRGFLEKVQRELEMSKPKRLNISNALIMYDIDWFRKVNETYGHDGGDYALCAVVETVKKHLRPYDIIGRYGGEEFVIFMPASKEESLHIIASRLCKAVEDAEIFYNGEQMRITASFGAVQMPPGADFNEAMLAVDAAMYKAKHNGRNQSVVGSIKNIGAEL